MIEIRGRIASAQGTRQSLESRGLALAENYSFTDIFFAKEKSLAALHADHLRCRVYPDGAVKLQRKVAGTSVESPAASSFEETVKLADAIYDAAVVVVQGSRMGWMYPDTDVVYFVEVVPILGPMLEIEGNDAAALQRACASVPDFTVEERPMYLLFAMVQSVR